MTVIWSPFTVKDTETIESVQRRFTERLPGLNCLSYAERLKRVNLHSLELRRLYTDYTRLAVWLSGNALASINVVALRQTRLVPGWVTVCERVNHLCM